MSLLEEFFAELDAKWQLPGAAKVPLRIIGSAALMLQADYVRGTKDADVLEVQALTKPIQSHLLDLAGKGTELHVRRRIYIDIVRSGLPFLPQAPIWHPLEDRNVRLACLQLEVLDVADVVVSKLKRFNSSDADDIDAMVERELVTHENLVARFREAVEYYAADARAEELPSYVDNLHRVERDSFGVSETAIELPDWI